MNKLAVVISVSVVLLTFLGLASRANVKKDSGGNFILKYPMPMKLFGLILLVLGSLLTYAITNTAIQKNEKDIVLLILTCTSFLVVSPLFMTIEFFFAKYLVNNKRIYSDSPWSSKREIHWKDVTEVRYSQGLQWFVVRNNKTKPIRISSMVAGINELGLIIEQQLPSDIYQKSLKDVK